MTALLSILRQQIERLGPLSISEYMAQCLFHPEHGYYTTRNPLGRGGDFITATEISQMFGELLGLWLAQNWMDQGAPTEFNLVELGPGRGQLMADVLRATKAVPGFHQALSLHLCEVNPVLKAEQQSALAAFNPCWFEHLSDLPEKPIYLIANEFLDCLPINQFILTDEGWKEHIVAWQDDALTFGMRDAGSVAKGLPTGHAIGTILETCPAANAIVQDAARQIAANGGCAIFVDYGHTGATGNSLQSLKAHQKVDPLQAPGEADLTAHVDFHALKTAVADLAQVHGPVTQGVLLERLGITARAQQLAAGLQGDKREAHIAAHRRLTHGEEMGTLFKAIALLPFGAALPPGFET